MIVTLTLSRYIARQFLLAVLSAWAALAALVAMFDFIELLRRSAAKPDATFALVVQIAALRVPFILMQILPFAVLLGGVICFWRLTRTSELIVARAAGISAWEFLTVPTLCAMSLGVIATLALSPLSSAMLSRAEALETAYIRTGGGPLALNGGQLWLRQSDRELTPKGVAIIHASAVALRDEQLTTGRVSVFRLDDGDRLLARIEAASASLAKGYWVFGEARAIRPDQLPELSRELKLATDLTVGRVQDSFAAPDTLSVWVLPDFIALLERSGFSSARHRLHFHALLALPLLAATMALVAAGFSMRPTRRGGVARMIGGGVSVGFSLFVISKVAEEFGQSGALPVILAAWAPAASGLMLAVALLLHTEDG
ncbi:MAG: LPS export ABC transporter permease LptG [Acetobacteraceae bacterium]|nr:LPS export ABC transporter permease LptG [Acetobacteraceae bacterium]